MEDLGATQTANESDEFHASPKSPPLLSARQVPYRPMRLTIALESMLSVSPDKLNVGTVSTNEINVESQLKPVEARSFKRHHMPGWKSVPSSEDKCSSSTRFYTQMHAHRVTPRLVAKH